MKENEIVSTVTVNYMVYEYEQKKKNYIQLGGVVTRDSYRKCGLNRWLMEHIIQKYKDRCDQIFLCSNDSAVEYYPKFGFEDVIEYVATYNWIGNKEKLSVYSEMMNEGNKIFQAKKLYIENGENRKILQVC